MNLQSIPIVPENFKKLGINQDLATAIEKTESPEAKLIRVLNESNIPAFSENSVTKYKKQQLHQLGILARFQFLRVALVVSLFMISAGTSLATLFMPIILVLSWIFASVTAPSLSQFCVSLVAFCISFCCLILLCGRDDVGTRWQKSSYASYYVRHRVPEFVDQTTRHLRKALPEAKFYVDSLGKDPFLIVAVQDIELYIAVWDEEDFQGIIF